MTAAANTLVLPRRKFLLGGAMTAIGLAAPKGASATAGPVELSVVERSSGEVLAVWRHEGKTFVAGEPGVRYGLRVANRSGARVLAVLSIDGVNILTGESAAYDQRGYVFDPYQSYAITGWRKSDDEVADFTFTPLPLSYAARTGRPGDVGVIGMAVFNEKVRPPLGADVSEDSQGPGLTIRRPIAEPPPADVAAPGSAAIARQPAAPSETPTPPGSMASLQDRAQGRRRDAPGEERLGTGHGPRELSPVRTVSFERATRRPQSVSQIEYDTFDHLVARGVIRSWTGPSRDPRPFPAAPEPGGYVPDPPGC